MLPRVPYLITALALAYTGDREFGSTPAAAIVHHMARYSAYFIGQDGRFVRSVDIVRNDDLTAIIAARAFIGKHAIELWEHDRKIVRFHVFAAPAAADLEPQESK